MILYPGFTDVHALYLRRLTLKVFNKVTELGLKRRVSRNGTLRKRHQR